MNLRQLFDAIPPDEKRRLAESIPCNLVYLRQIAGGHRKPSPEFARRLVSADSRLTLSALRPDIWGDA